MHFHGIILAQAVAPALLLCLLLLATTPTSTGLRRLQQSSARSGKRSIAQPDYNFYHRKQDLLDQVAALVTSNPATMKLEKQSAQNGSYSANMQIVTVELAGHSTIHFEKARLLLDFGEHGREYVSSELGLLMMKTLADRAALEQVFSGDSERSKRLIRLLEASVLKILPMENEAGRALVESGKLCERKNGRGVDPNRNWPIDWGVKEKDYDPQEEYPGLGPFSEPEVQMLHGLASHFRPHVWLNIHSGMEAMFTPYDHKAEVPAAAQPALALLKQVQAEFMKGTGCVVGSGGKSVGYLAHGTATDYMFEVLKVPMAYTWEIYGDFGADFHDCFRMFNPLTQDQLQVVLKRWLLAIMKLLELVPTHPAMEGVGLIQAAAAGGPVWEAALHNVTAAASTHARTRGGGATLTPSHTAARASVPTSASSAHGSSSGGGSDPGGASLVAAAAASGSSPSSSHLISDAATVPQQRGYWHERSLLVWIGVAGMVMLGVMLHRFGMFRLRPGLGRIAGSRLQRTRTPELPA